MPAKRGYPQSCTNAHDSSLCGGMPPRKVSPDRGGARPRRAAGFRSPTPQRARRLCQPPRPQPTCKEPHPPRMGAQVRRKSQAYSQLLFGREREGGASLREAASLALLNSNCSSGKGVWGRGASLREAASPPESSHRLFSLAVPHSRVDCARLTICWAMIFSFSLRM